jgi:serine/threonine kinase 16
MHDYRAPLASRSDPRPSRENQSSAATSSSARPKKNVRVDNGHSDDEDEDDEMFPHPEGDAEGGYSYHGPSSHSASAPLVSKQPTMDDGVVFDGDEELSRIQQNGGQNGASAGETELVPYAHRDLKPGFVSSFYMHHGKLSDVTLVGFSV